MAREIPWDDVQKHYIVQVGTAQMSFETPDEMLEFVREYEVTVQHKVVILVAKQEDMPTKLSDLFDDDGNPKEGFADIG